MNCFVLFKAFKRFNAFKSTLLHYCLNYFVSSVSPFYIIYI